MKTRSMQVRTLHIDNQARASAGAAPETVGLGKLAPIETHATLVGSRLARLLSGRAPFDDAYRHILATPGKRLRAGLTLACSTLLSTVDSALPPSAEALDVACAVEMLHEASLVHDDICDG
jgi:geranylgeranyl pyrophosphate synthase